SVHSTGSNLMLRLVHHSECRAELSICREEPFTRLVDLETGRAELAIRYADFAVKRGKLTPCRGKPSAYRAERSCRSSEACGLGGQSVPGVEPTIRVGGVERVFQRGAAESLSTRAGVSGEETEAVALVKLSSVRADLNDPGADFAGLRGE